MAEVDPGLRRDDNCGRYGPSTSAAGSSAPEGQDEMTEEHITRVSLKQARKMKSETDWARLDAMTEEEIDRAAAEDPDNPPMTEEDWKNARVVWPQGKAPVTLRLDKDIIAWFKHQGRGYQTRINAVLRAFVEAQKPRDCPAASGVSSQPSIPLNQRAKHQKAERA